MNKEETKTIADFLANCYLDQQRFNKILFSKIGYKNTDKIFRILGYIYYNNDEHTILGKDLTLYLETSPAATSQILNSFCSAGILDRDCNPEDRRGNIVSVNKEFIKKAKSEYKNLSNPVVRTIKSFSPEEQKVIYKFMEKMNEESKKG